MTNPNDPNFVEDVIEMLNRSVSEGDFIFDSDNDYNMECASTVESDEPDARSIGSFSLGGDVDMDVEADLSGIYVTPNDNFYDEVMVIGEQDENVGEQSENVVGEQSVNVVGEQSENVVGEKAVELVDTNDVINQNNSEQEENVVIANDVREEEYRERQTVPVRKRGTGRGGVRVRSGVRTRGGTSSNGRGGLRVRGAGRIRGSRRGRASVRGRNGGEVGDGEREGGAKKVTKKQQERIECDRQWLHVSNNDPGPVSSFPTKNDDAGVNIPSTFDKDTKPIHYFSLFFNDSLLNLICTESNLYGGSKRDDEILSPNSRYQKWEPLTIVELKAVLGVLINMGMHPLPDLKDYFSNKWVNKMPFFSDVFNRDQFLILFWSLHFNHEEGPDRDLKIRPVVDHIREMCKTFYTPSSSVAVDESTIAFKGNIVFKVYNPMKPTKFGMKIFVISDSMNGYIYGFDPYYGKNEETLAPDEDLLKTTKTVIQLCKTLIKDPSNPPSGTHVYIDRYYNSPQLAKELLKLNMYVTGTVLGNRTNMPILSRELQSGEMEGRRNGDLAVVFWKDKRVVTVLSTKHYVDTHHMVDVPSKYPGVDSVSKPEAIADYTKHMGGVDRSDHFISNYQFLRRSTKWYRKMFFWLLDVALVDSYILYKQMQEAHQETPMSHKNFRISIIEDLVREHMQSRFRLERRRPGRPRENVCQRLDGKLHLMGKMVKGSRKCHVCLRKKLRKETVYFCKTCVSQPHLHPDECFEIYHTQAEY